MPKPTCSIAEFRTIGRQVHHPDARHMAGMRWLRLNLPHCNVDQVRLLAANRTQWFGTADDPELAGVIDRALEYLVGDKPELLRSLFTPAPMAGDPANAAGVPTSTVARGIRAPDPALQQAYPQQQAYSQQQAYPQQQVYPQQPAYPQQQAYPQVPSATPQ